MALFLARRQLSPCVKTRGGWQMVPWLRSPRAARRPDGRWRAPQAIKSGGLFCPLCRLVFAAAALPLGRGSLRCHGAHRLCQQFVLCLQPMRGGVSVLAAVGDPQMIRALTNSLIEILRHQCFSAWGRRVFGPAMVKRQ